MMRTAKITQYCNSPRWFIRVSEGIRNPRTYVSGHCPGTLNQDFDTAEHAAEVAKWWGYTPEIIPHVHSE